MGELVDIQNYKRKYEGEISRVAKSNISQQNKNLIMEFNRHYVLQGSSLARRIKVLESLTRIAKSMNKDFDKATKEDLMDYIENLEATQYSEWSKHTFKSILKRFYKWLKGDDEEFPDEIRWLKASKKRIKNRIPEELITRDDAIKMIDKAQTIRDKAFISSLFESGCRVSELGNLRIKHVVFDQYGSVIVVSGKTGMRRVRLIDSTPYLANWIENHPHKDNPEMPLWVSTMRKDIGMGYGTIHKVLRQTALRAGVRRKVNPHMFRHSRSTINANFLTEAQMNNYFGWVQGSRMPSIYVHLSGRDVDATIINMHSPDQKVVINRASESNFEPKCCPRCRNNNPATSKYCNRCGGLLTIEINQ